MTDQLVRLAGIGIERDALRKRVAELEDERNAVHAWGEEQKRRRVYYQDIVYAVCNILDSCWPATHVVCGTINEASDEVQRAVAKLKGERDALTPNPPSQAGGSE